MRVFVSYSFRPENAWVEDFVLPMIECFGHEPVTGRILDAGALDDEVRRKIRQCRRVLCFVTRASPRRNETGATVGYHPPDWVRDELMLARGAGKEAIEFRERDVEYGGASPFHAHVPFDREQIPELLVQLAQRIADWPVGPLQFRLAVPDALRDEFITAANVGPLRARCVVYDDAGMERSSDELEVRVRDGQLVVPFWIKPDPNLSVEIEVTLGARRLACRGLSPAVREVRLSPL